MDNAKLGMTLIKDLLRIALSLIKSCRRLFSIKPCYCKYFLLVAVVSLQNNNRFWFDPFTNKINNNYSHNEY
jgi:hypothetical protein